MKWTLKNAMGEPVTWYSEEEMQQAQNKLNKIKCVCSDIYTKTNECKALKKVILEIIGRPF